MKSENHSPFFHRILFFMLIILFVSCGKLFGPDYQILQQVKKAENYAEQYLQMIKDNNKKASYSYLDSHLRNDKKLKKQYEQFYSDNFLKMGPIVGFVYKNYSHEEFYTYKNGKTVTNTAIYLQYEVTFPKNRKNYVIILTKTAGSTAEYKIDSVHNYNSNYTLIGKY